MRATTLIVADYSGKHGKFWREPPRNCQEMMRMSKKTVVKTFKKKEERVYKKDRSLTERINDADDRAERLEAAGMVQSAQREHENANRYRRQLGMKPFDYGKKGD